VSYNRSLYCCALRSYALSEAVCAWFLSGSMPICHRFKSRATTSVLPMPAPGVKALTGRGSMLPPRRLTGVPSRLGMAQALPLQRQVHAFTTPQCRSAYRAQSLG
jgi:hypothetical protein